MRELFNLPDGPYFLSHSVGCLPKSAEKYLAKDLLQPWKDAGGAAWPAWLNTIEQFKAQLALLLNGEPQDICPQINLSSALTKLLCALPPARKKKYTVLMHANAFPSMGFVVKALANQGFVLKLIEPEVAVDDLKHWQQQITDDVCCVLITHVFSNTGQVSPVEQIVALAKHNASLAIVDVAQSVGILNIDLGRWQADAVIGSCVKWLCGGPGAGFLWVAPNLVKTLHPIDVGWFSHQTPFEFEINHFCYDDTANRFWGGTPSIAPYALALAGLTLLNEIGVHTVYAHNRALVRTFLGLVPHRLAQSFDLKKIGGTLCLTVPSIAVEPLQQALINQKCYFDIRHNTFRLSFHLYNHSQEVQQLGETFAKFA
jgi:selenocysteine lyase/cysteine desulfurase